MDRGENIFVIIIAASRGSLIYDYTHFHKTFSLTAFYQLKNGYCAKSIKLNWLVSAAGKATGFV